LDTSQGLRMPEPEAYDEARSSAAKLVCNLEGLHWNDVSNSRKTIEGRLIPVANTTRRDAMLNCEWLDVRRGQGASLRTHELAQQNQLFARVVGRQEYNTVEEFLATPGAIEKCMPTRGPSLGRAGVAQAYRKFGTAPNTWGAKLDSNSHHFMAFELGTIVRHPDKPADDQLDPAPVEHQTFKRMLMDHWVTKVLETIENMDDYGREFGNKVQREGWSALGGMKTLTVAALDEIRACQEFEDLCSAFPGEGNKRKRGQREDNWTQDQAVKYAVYRSAVAEIFQDDEPVVRQAPKAYLRSKNGQIITAVIKALDRSMEECKTEIKQFVLNETILKRMNNLEDEFAQMKKLLAATPLKGPSVLEG